MSQVGSGQFHQMRQSDLYRAWAAVAPDPDSFPTLMDRTGALLRRPYDWTDEIRGLEMPVLLVYGDADSIPPWHAAEFFALLGGGLQDAGWDGARRTHHRLCHHPRAHPLHDLRGARAGGHHRRLHPLLRRKQRRLARFHPSEPEAIAVHSGGAGSGEFTNGAGPPLLLPLFRSPAQSEGLTRVRACRGPRDRMIRRRAETMLVGSVTLTLDPGTILLWAFIGLVAGFLASKVVTGRGKGVLADIVVGIIGALAGGFLAQMLSINFSIPGHTTITEIIIAFVGAVILLVIVRLLTGNGRRWSHSH
jgi:uncharacterized membrane protein YeaQ/YmgE (transglycosylase-associated protein family)